MRHVVDLKSWSREDNDHYFQNFLNPSFSLTTEIDCTETLQLAKKRNHSFFLYYLYAALRAANEVKEFRYRIEKEVVAYYDKVEMLTPVKVGENGKIVTVRIAYYEDFPTFYREAKQVIDSTTEESDPHKEENEMRRTGHYDVVLLCSTPNVYFTSLSYAPNNRYGSRYPLINVGKVVTREGRKKMPFALNVHHGLVDAIHISDFLERVERSLR